MKQNFITTSYHKIFHNKLWNKTLSQHLITKLYRNKFSDRYFITNIHKNLWDNFITKYFITNFHNLYHNNWVTDISSHTLSQQLSDRYFITYFITTTSSQIIWETIYIFHDVMNDAISHYKILFNDEYNIYHNIYHNNWVTDISQHTFQILHHNILRQYSLSQHSSTNFRVTDY